MVIFGVFPKMGVFGHFGKFGIFGQFWGFLAKSPFLHIFRTPGIPGPRRGSTPTIDPDIRSCHNPDMSIHGFDIMNDATPPGPRRKFDHPPPVQIFGGSVCQASSCRCCVRDGLDGTPSRTSHESFSCCQRDQHRRFPETM